MRTGEETCLGQMRVFVGGQAQIIIAMALSRIKNIIKKEFDQNGASPFYSEVSFFHDLIRVKQRVKRDIGKNRVKVILVK